MECIITLVQTLWTSLACSNHALTAPRVHVLLTLDCTLALLSGLKVLRLNCMASLVLFQLCTKSIHVLLTALTHLTGISSVASHAPSQPDCWYNPGVLVELFVLFSGCQLTVLMLGV